jgi:hypothetical protein
VIATILRNEKKKLQFIAPDFLLDEVEEHLPEIMEDNNLTKSQARALLKEFTKNIVFYKIDDIPKKYIDKAQEIVKNIDPDDYPFIALHLQKGHRIWTCDFRLIRGLIEEGIDICITTKELKEKTYKKTNN